MGRFMASRSAGLKLAWIIIVLLVPIAVYAVLLARSLSDDIAKIKREQQGAAYIDIVMPLMAGALKEHTDPVAAAAFTDNGREIAQLLGFPAAHSAFVERLQSPAVSHRSIIAQAVEHVRLAGQASGLLLDSDPESFALASLLSTNLPELIQDYDRLSEISSPAVNTGVGDHERLTHVALVLGALRENNARVSASLNAARHGSVEPGDYLMADNSNSALGLIAGDLQRKLLSTRVALDKRRHEFHSILTATRSKYLAGFNDLSSTAAGHLKVLLEQRHGAHWRNMALMVGLSFFATVLGVGSAAQMFKSTLRRLDEVETARAEAEAMSGRLEIINSDVAKLNSELNDNVTRLKNAQDELLSKGRMEQLGHLTATVAHELRNPLGAVRTSAFLLGRRVANKGLGVEPQLLRIQNGVVRCDNIITQLLDFSRSNAPMLTATDLDSWLVNIVEQEAQGLPSAVEIEFSPGLGGRTVDLDEARLSRVVVNLLSNAAEAMVGRGDDPSKFTTSTPRITIETNVAERGAEIQVRDNGPGISAADLPRILEPLFTTKNFGTGLGLPAVQRILEQHGGGLEVKSEPGQGACFTAWLPFEGRESKAA